MACSLWNVPWKKQNAQAKQRQRRETKRRQPPPEKGNHRARKEGSETAPSYRVLRVNASWLRAKGWRFKREMQRLRGRRSQCKRAVSAVLYPAWGEGDKRTCLPVNPWQITLKDATIAQH